jgi:ketosteroid isomerase-like protein
MSKEAALAQIGAVAATVPREQVIDSIRAFLGSYPARSSADIDRRTALFAEQVVFEDPVGAAPLVGTAALRQFFEGAVAAGWIIHMAPRRIVVCGNEAVSLTAARWGLAGETPAEVEIVHTFAFDDAGRITSLRVFFDAGTIS